MFHAFLILATSSASIEHEKSKVAFYVLGILFVAWALVLAGLGTVRPEFPGTVAAKRGVMALTVVLMAGAMATSIITA